MSSERCLSRLSEHKDLRVHVIIALAEVCPYISYTHLHLPRWHVFALPCTCVGPSRHTIDQTYFCGGLSIKKFRYFFYVNRWHASIFSMNFFLYIYLAGYADFICNIVDQNLKIFLYHYLTRVDSLHGHYFYHVSDTNPKQQNYVTYR
jgi:hypothetical protein